MTQRRQWMEVRPEGLYCRPGDFYIDPMRPVPHALVTHGHADHARPGNTKVTATPNTLAIMAVRYGGDFTQTRAEAPFGQVATIGDARVSFHPAGHILGSAQICVEHAGCRFVFSGDYKRTPDATAETFEIVPCDVFVTEATFALPVFRHPPMPREIARLLASVEMFPERCHVIGVYALGKCQRVIRALRDAGHDAPVYLHGALIRLTELYESLGIALGDCRPAAGVPKAELAGRIVLAPPSAIADRWSRRLPDPVTCAASGWMQIRARAKQGLIELPLVISDHADWDELNATIDETGASQVWVTHGRDDALVYACEQRGLKAKALHLLGYDDEED